MNKKFSWVGTHKKITQYLSTKENSQQELIDLLKSVDIGPFNDRSAPGDYDIELGEIDPFTFFCYIYKYGNKKRLNLLQQIAEKLNIEKPLGESGIPSTQPQLVWLFPNKYLRVNNEISRLWDFFKKALTNEITNDDFANVLQIQNVGRVKLTEALFYINPENYLPINGPTRPYLKEVLDVDPNFETYNEYIEILDKIKQKTELPFYEISYEAWKWNNERKKVNYWIFQGSPKVFDFETALKNEILTDWTVSAHKDKIKIGDKVILWITGDQAGCYALAEITSTPHNKTSSPDDHLWRIENTSELKTDIKITHNLVDNPILKIEIEGIEELANLKVGNQGTNFSASEEQFQAILKMTSAHTTMKDTSAPLNQILYGPPGTGKTYHTIDKALQIIDGADFWKEKKRHQLLERFNQLKKEGRIGFVTFHQSFSYEDFVEGITPQLIQSGEDTVLSENGDVKYELKEGLFKYMCRMAKGVSSDKIIVKNHYDFDNVQYYKMSIGGREKTHIHDWCIKNGKIALGWGRDSNFQSMVSLIDDWSKFRDRFKSEYPDLVEESTYNIQAVHAFLKMKKGDVVLVSKGNNVIDAVGVIKDNEYIYDDQQDFGYYQFRNIEWLASNLNASPELFVSKKISQQTIYSFDQDDVKKEYIKKKFAQNEENSAPEKYVLIIDEINRGNVAAIFGELITLIEPDKRIGNPEALEAQLPYSKEWFGVPSNLHIIGTMNTADRSVEALDTALRRRFSFVEMLPNPAVIKKHGVSGGVIEGIDLVELLKVINDRIEALVDRDHTIGHSYFMNAKSVNDLRLVFKDKIVPLLQEYFFGDFGKIGLVLGSDFVEKMPQEIQFASLDGYEETSHFQKERFRLKTIDNDFPIKKALGLLMNKID